VFSTWGFGTGWIDMSLVILIVMTFMGPIINLRRLKSILAATNAETSSVPSSNLMEKVKDRTLWSSVIIMTMLAIGILFLMTVKPAMLGSLVVVMISIVLGFIVANLLLSRVSRS
ncbi:MAG TPA: hypothetical protein VEV44_17145, partial [Pseudoneobacillus sp.]|nr:hypothetical protein [Pseudoneobacillus sp.]